MTRHRHQIVIFSSSRGPRPDTEILASSIEYPPLNSLDGNDSVDRERRLYGRLASVWSARYTALGRQNHPGVKIAEDDFNYGWV